MLSVVQVSPAFVQLAVPQPQLAVVQLQVLQVLLIV
jgi:hypothetical protein